jgi:NADH-quinone oxidoreductase subunit N
MNFKSNEAGMKYFLMGSLHWNHSFGICLIYGAMGSFDVIEISALSQSAELPVCSLIELYCYNRNVV